MGCKKYYFGDAGDYITEGFGKQGEHDRTFFIFDNDEGFVEIYTKDFEAIQVAFEKMLRGE